MPVVVSRRRWPLKTLLRLLLHRRAACRVRKAPWKSLHPISTPALVQHCIGRWPTWARNPPAGAQYTRGSEGKTVGMPIFSLSVPRKIRNPNKSRIIYCSAIGLDHLITEYKRHNDIDRAFCALRNKHHENPYCHRHFGIFIQQICNFFGI